MSDRAAPDMADDGPGKFLRYAALVTEKTPGSSAGPDRVPPRYGYAILAGINRLLLEDVGEIAEGLPIAFAMARFEDAMAQTWVGTPKQLEAEMAKLAKRGLLREDGETLIVYPCYVALVVEHAQTVFLHMTGREAPEGSEPKLPDWLCLNAAIFEALFYAEFGLWWRKLREQINGKLQRRARKLSASEQRKSARRYNKDHFKDTSLWVVINLLSRFDKLTDHQMSRYIDDYALGDLAGSIQDMADAVELLAAGGAIVREGAGRYSIAPDLASGLEKHAAATTKGMSDLDQVCRRWAVR